MDKLNAADVVREFARFADQYDIESELLSIMFDTCAEMTYRGLEVPAELQYSPGALADDPREPESYWFELLAGLEDDELKPLVMHYNRKLDRLRAVEEVAV